eukprot:TRINITY_DN5921_c0_g1_i1.p1 TRINITY_DN5921_c0_g1~~TRINITY_DN5921_c0_g1_i1.p1  ORF type:complete len:273 (+),score=26.97 TRINITY_DN5921_c0_g1_i1:467-1285(+)
MVNPQLIKEAFSFLRFAVFGAVAVQILELVWEVPEDWDPHFTFAVSSIVVYNVVWVTAVTTLQVLECGGEFPRKPTQVPTEELTRGSFKACLIGHFSTTPLLLLFVIPSIVDGGLGSIFPSNTTLEFPNFLTAFTQLFTCHFSTELSFYAAHTFLHTQSMYARYHKRHHEYTGTVVLGAEHSSFLETVANSLCTFAGPVILGEVHLACWLVFFTADMWGVYERHSGRDLSNTFLSKLGFFYPENALHHDRHHTINTGNYGHQFFDILFGTLI